MWTTHLKVFRQVAVVNLYESLFSKNTAGRPLAAGLVSLGASLEQQKEGKMSFLLFPRWTKFKPV